jgi:integrase
MTRPRGENGFIKRVGPSWIGFYHEYDSLIPNAKRSQHQKRIGAATGPQAITKTAAQQLFRAFMSRRESSLNLPLAATLADLWLIHERKYERTGTGQAATMRSLWAKHIAPVFGPVQVAKIRPADIEAFFDRMALEYSESTLDKARVLLHALFDRAKEHNLISESPSRAAYIRIESSGPAHALTAAQVRDIRAQLAGEDLLKFDLCWMLGLDRSALRALRGDDITSEGLRIDEGRVEGQSTKLKTQRRHATIALTADLASRLAPYASRGSAWLWPALRGSGPWDAAAWLAEVLRPAAAAAGVKAHIDFRTLRRTAGTLLQQSGAKTAATAGVLRNSPAIVLAHYTDPTHASEQRAALDAAWLTVTGGRVM